MRNGTRPKGASPARRRSERARAGPIEPRNSLHGEDHSTTNLGRVVTLDEFLELERFNHARGTPPSFSIVISILSPTAVLVSAAMRHGSSSTDVACVRIGAKRQGCKSLWIWITVKDRSKYTTSMGNPIPRV